MPILPHKSRKWWSWWKNWVKQNGERYSRCKKCLNNLCLWKEANKEQQQQYQKPYEHRRVESRKHSLCANTPRPQPSAGAEGLAERLSPALGTQAALAATAKLHLVLELKPYILIRMGLQSLMLGPANLITQEGVDVTKLKAMLFQGLLQVMGQITHLKPGNTPKAAISHPLNTLPLPGTRAQGSLGQGRAKGPCVLLNFFLGPSTQATKLSSLKTMSSTSRSIPWRHQVVLNFLRHWAQPNVCQDTIGPCNIPTFGRGAQVPAFGRRAELLLFLNHRSCAVNCHTCFWSALGRSFQNNCIGAHLPAVLS